MTELTELALIWAGTLTAVVAAKLTRLTPVVYYLGVGAVLVNAGLLPSESSEFIRGLSDVGIILIMFALGFDENANNFLHSIKRSWGIAFFGALGPFVVAYAVAQYFWQDSNVSLMCALAMTATAVSLTMVSLKSEGLGSSAVATRIMTSAVLDDIASLALVAIAIPSVTNPSEVSIASVGWIVVKAIAFFAVVAFVGAVVLPHRRWRFGIPRTHVEHESASRTSPALQHRYPGLKQLFAWDDGKHAVLFSLLIALVMALLGSQFGFPPAVGAYLAGLIIAEEYFCPGREVGSFQDTRRVIDSAAFSWIGPVFFVTLGAHLHFDAGLILSVLPQTIALTIGVMLIQIASASLAARFTGGMGMPASVMIGLGMLGRAELAFVVMDIAYVQFPILTDEAFYTLMLTCFFLNIAVPLSIHWWKPIYERAELVASDETTTKSTPSTQLSLTAKQTSPTSG